MKKMFKLQLIVAALAILSFSGCKSDDEETNDVTDALEAEYTETSTEDSKKDVEDAGITFVNKIDQLEDEEAIDIMIEMINLMEEEEASTDKFNVLSQVTEVLSNDSKSTIEVYDVLKDATEEGLALSDSFAAQTATYEYNFTTKEFDKKENTSAIVFLFPGKDGDLTNTAEVKISDFEVKEISSPSAETDLTYLEVPTNLNIFLKYNDVEIMSYNLTANYMTDGVPTSLKNTVTIGEFSFVQELTHDQYKEASFDFSFKNNDDVLFGYGIEIKGDWSSDNIDDNTYTTTENYEYKWTEYTSEEEEVYIEEIINSSNAYIKLMDLKVVSQVNVKALIDGEQTFDMAHEDDRDEYGDYPDAIEKLEADNLVELAKENAKFVLVYSKNNGLIASLEPYTVEDTYTYNHDGQSYSQTDYDLDFRLVFKDESKISMETYVEDELSGFFDALNDFITTINNNYDSDVELIDTASKQ